MATTMELISNNKIQSLFENLESQKSLLTKCTDLYDTLTSHFTSLQNSIDSKILTLESKLNSLDSNFQKCVNDLEKREDSIPDRLVSLSSEIQEKKQSAIDEFRKKLDTRGSLSRVLRCLCRRMDHEGLTRVLIERRREKSALWKEIGRAMKECVDPDRMVLETVKAFVAAKGAAKGMSDKRWACGVVVSGLFPLEELKSKRGPMFSRKIVAEAEAVVRKWREKAEEGVGGGDGGGDGDDNDDGNKGNDGDNGNDNDNKGNEGGDDDGDGNGYCDKGSVRWSRMGPAELAMFLQVVVGFGLTEIFDVEFYKKVVMEFAARREDMAKLAVLTLGDKLPDFIEQLIENGKEVEAVYFALEAGLTSRFKPALLIQAGLDRCKKNATEILEKGDHATVEALNFQMKYIRTLIKCVEDNKLEAEYSADKLKKQLSILGKTKANIRAERFADRKKGIESSKPSNKRSGTPSRRSGGGGNPSHSAKRPRYPSYSKRGEGSRPLSPVSKYLGAYNVASQSAYGPNYGPSLGPSSDQISQQYGVSGGSVPSLSVGAHLVRMYGSQSTYEANTTTNSYEPPFYQPPTYAP